MQRFIDGWHSPSLNKWMEIVTYGHYGFPLLMFPTAAADYLEYERFYVLDAIQGSIEAGKTKVFSINSINRESWLNDELHPKYKALRQVQYNNYIADEVVPYIWNSCQGRFGVITAGASLGAFHCANQLFRRPDLFAGCISMSGAYDIRGYYKGDYYGDNVYFNNPVDYLPNVEGWTLEALRNKEHIHIVTGQGNYENPGASRRLSGILSQKGIPHELDLWVIRHAARLADVARDDAGLPSGEVLTERKLLTAEGAGDRWDYSLCAPRRPLRLRFLRIDG